jgi:acyl-[acyl-carrier-protein] desaturase
MDHMQAGYTNAHDDEVLHSLAYVAFQELATRISHRNTGRATGDPVAEQLLARVAADENLHMVFYRNLLGAALELAPNQAMRAITDVVAGFQMPGANIDGFGRKALSIALAGIYDLRQHRDEVLNPVLRQWDVWNVTGLDAEGERAREQLAAHMAELDAAATRFEEKRAARRARDAAREAAAATP